MITPAGRPDPPATAAGPAARAAGGPAWDGLLGMSAVVAVVLLATSGRYGYHRDELYFLAAGHHLAWGYPDQPPLTPAIIHLTDLLGGSLPVLRTPSALAAALTVLLTGLTTRELGGGRRAQLIAAACSGVSAVTLVTGHFVTTTTFDVLFSAALCWLLARTIRTGDHRLLVPAGLVLGVGLMNKNLIGVLAAVLVASIAITGPRRLLASRWLWLGALIAVAGGLPYVLWQAANGWPQVHMAGRISGGDDQGGRVGFIPFQLVLVSPLLVPIWLAGLRRLLRDPDLRPYRAFGLGYLLLGAVYLVTGGKAYYLAGMYPVLLAAGGIAADGWLRRAAERGRGRSLRTRLTVAIGLSAVINALIGLALLPTSALGPVLAVNPDAGEMVGWPRYADAVASAWNLLPPGDRGHAVILAQNYGEAGALLRYGPERHLPAPYSGHNGFAFWGVPPDSATTIVVTGYNQLDVDHWFGSCSLAGRVDNHQGVDNDEQGGPIFICHDPRQPWSVLWPQLEHLG
ncbi:MAG TPA: glycosyltransferase family 39 protein [Mycobacteriales bacterium]|nr:glycosyltransferase family 39 protein [Mycobacteriales bacterium]